MALQGVRGVKPKRQFFVSTERNIPDINLLFFLLKDLVSRVFFHEGICKILFQKFFLTI